MAKWMAPLVAIAVLAIAPAASAKHVKGGQLVVGRSAAGVELGMTQSQVRALIGRPFYSNANGFAQYAPDSATNIFDLYYSPEMFVRQIVLSGGRFKIGTANVFERGILRKLKRRYGRRLVATKEESGDPIYRLKSRYRGWTVWTDFMVTRHSLDREPTNVIMLFPYH